MHRPIAVLIAVAGCVVTLSGCGLLPLLPQQPTEQPTAPGDPVSEAPTGWSDLELCRDVTDRWVWVDGYPAAEMEAAGLEAECGGTYFTTDLPTYTSVGDGSVTDEQLDALRAQLQSSGYTESGSTFEHPQPGDEPGLAGTWHYERNADDPSAAEAIFIVNLWLGTDPAQYETFVDYESPGTRELER